MQTIKRARILNASAGAGKTFRLVLKYLCDVLEQPECYRNILAVTFTNKATEEMKSRIITELNNLAEGYKSNYLEKIKETTKLSEDKIREKARVARTEILHDYSRFTVLTIDRFFQRILRAFINELNLDLSYNLELDVKMLLERSADSLIESITNEENRELQDWLMRFAEERIDSNKLWDMRGDLSKLGEKLFKDGASNRFNKNVSKEELHKIVGDLVESDELFMGNIKEKAQGMLEHIDAHGLDITDFKGGKTGFTSHIVKYANGIIPDYSKGLPKGLSAALEDKTNWYNDKSKRKAELIAAADTLYGDLVEIHELINIYTIKTNTTKLLQNNYRSYALLSDLYAQLDDICKKENIMILDKTKELLAKFIDHSNAPFIYEKVGNRYDRYMIDEFQDTSTREWNNLRPLLIEALSSNEKASVFIVGDIKQSIYRWRGGDWRLLNGQVVNDLGPDNTVIEPLGDNYRSLQNIVKFNNELINNVKTNDNNYLNSLLANSKAINDTTLNEYKNIVERAYANCTQTPKNQSDEKGYVEVCLHDPNFEGETPLFIEAIANARSRGYSYKDILILVRYKKHGRKIAQALYEYKNRLISEGSEDIFNILTSDSLTIESCEVVRFIISIFRLAINQYDNIERAIFNSYLPDRTYGDKFSEEDKEMLNTIAHLSPLEAFEYIVDRFELYNRTEHIAYIQALHEQIFAYVSNNVADIQHYLSWWDERGHKESLTIEKTDNTIEIMTIHKSKGLERDVVIIPYCEWNMSPSTRRQPMVWAEATPITDDPAHEKLSKIGEFPTQCGSLMKESEFAQEYYKELVMSHIDGLNMLYVAVTRAKKELYMYIPKDMAPKDKDNKKQNEEANEKVTIDTTTPLIETAIVDICQKVENDDNEDSAEDVIKPIRYTYGEKCNVKSSNSEDKSTILRSYPTSKPHISVRKPSKRYMDEGMTPGTESCTKGIQLHKVFEGANSVEDLYAAIERLETNKRIDSAEVKLLRNNIESILTNEMVAEWFGGEWDDIKHEAGIIDKGENLRPDRVMIKGDRAIVVDYKFGDNTSSSYHKKMKKYIDLLDKMKRYTTIEGYIWYVKRNEIVKV